MTKEELNESIISIKIETLLNWEDYFNYKRVGDTATTFNMREYLVALDIYINVLEYIYNSWNYLEELEVEDRDINDCVSAAIDCLRTFNTRYYG